jgi:hypothetical protein
MNRKKLFVRVLLVCLLFSMVTHWRDVKNGFIDGCREGYNSIPAK